MKSYSFFTALFLGNIFLVGFIFIFGFWRITFEMNRNVSELSLRFQNIFLSLVKTGLEESWDNADKSIENYCNSYSKVSGLRLTVVSLDGRALGDSDYPVDKMQLHNTASHPEIVAALSGQYAESIRLSQTKQIRYRYIASPIYHGGEIVGVVRVALPVSDLAAERRNIFYGVLTVFVLMLFAAAILLMFLNWIWYKPLRIISESALRISAGKFEPVTQVTASRELAHLVNVINQMQKTVVSQLETISRQRERLQVILQNLPDAVFAINSSDQVVYYNESAKRMFELDDLSEPVAIQFLLRYSAALNFYFQETENMSNVIRSELINIKTGERKRFFEAEKISVPDETDTNGIAVLLLFNDVTTIAETNRMKADFVANTSHELRTPLATIRATLDNVSDGILGDVSEFRGIIEILDRQVKRLELLTYDLLSLHDVECGGVSGRLEETTAANLKTQLEALFAVKVKESGVKLFIESENIDKPFLTDVKRLELALQNLVDNAIKFTATGGVVRLTFRFEESGVLIICCEDNGCGIAEEEQPRVFERFYRVKSRSGVKVAGTGLGLAIVKHAVERLGGTIKLESVINKGSVFKIEIPINYPNQKTTQDELPE
ncbi:MAG: PAS domain-containing protein [Planctomycetaceae bacterium]|jgi:two-component system phosphate regulon sensor histidine kinase PhoR|nr:PAS domain-containing protein [Planctomycetaceae bacterium]